MDFKNFDLIFGYQFLLWFTTLFVIARQQSTLKNFDGNISDSTTTSGCTFPDEIQGVYKTQDFSVAPTIYDYGLRDPVKYKDIFIGPTSIPYWGDCYEKVGQAYVLGLKKVGGYMCYRCFALIERTPNLLQGQTLSESSCYRTVQEAKQTCLDASLLHPGEGIILWRSENIQYQYCPVGGRANLTYSLGNRLHCPFPVARPSTISNCKLGYQLDVSFKSCTFPPYEMSLRCLGTWDAGKGNGETYIAVYNTLAEEFRCGIYKDDREHSGYAVAALSNDSSCSNMLINNTHGYEVFAFFSEPQATDWPAYQSRCTFPDWLQTDWEVMTVGKDLISYYQNNDPTTMMTLYGKCSSVDKDNYVTVFTRTHCGDTLGYHCLWFTKRSRTVTELKLGLMNTNDNSAMLCSKENVYQNSSWTALTVRHLDNSSNQACSHLGFYSTIKPFDQPGQHCYNVTVDCQDSNKMVVVVFQCGTNVVYEKNRYRCLASWTEGDHFFTYTYREDTTDRGCFVSKFNSNKQLFMVWTERNCQRNVEFEKLIMDYNNIDKPVLVLENKRSCSDEENVRSDNKISKPTNSHSNSANDFYVLSSTLLFYFIFSCIAYYITCFQL